MKIEKKKKNINLQNVVNILLPIIREKSTLFAVSKIKNNKTTHSYICSFWPTKQLD